MIAEMSATIDALQSRVAALEAAARNNAPESQAAAPGLPQIGENWRYRMGWESGALRASGSKTHPLQDDSNRTFTAAGRYLKVARESPCDLVSRISAAHVEPPPADHIADAGEVAEFPWHDHDGSGKCPVPKRRRGERIEVRFESGNCFDHSGATDWRWTADSGIIAWRYTQPDPKPAKAKKWGPWVNDYSGWRDATDANISRQVEWDCDYIRHRVRL